MSHDHAHGSDYVHHPHVLRIRIYLGVLLSLVVLTYITVRVSYFDFGQWNLIIAMSVASIKASLVVLFFMHLKYDERFNAVVFLSAFVFLSLFFIFTLSDTTRRGEMEPLERGTILVLPESSIPPGDGHGDAGHAGGGTAAPGGAGGHGGAAPADSGAHAAAPGDTAAHGTPADAGGHGEAAPAETTTGGH